MCGGPSRPGGRREECVSGAQDRSGRHAHESACDEHLSGKSRSARGTCHAGVIGLAQECCRSGEETGLRGGGGAPKASRVRVSRGITSCGRRRLVFAGQPAYKLSGKGTSPGIAGRFVEQHRLMSTGASREARHAPPYARLLATAKRLAPLSLQKHRLGVTTSETAYHGGTKSVRLQLGRFHGNRQ